MASLPFVSTLYPVTSQLDTLTQINLDDLVASFGWQNHAVPASVLRRIFFGPAQKFARQIVEYDDLMGQAGLPEASRGILQKYYLHDLRVHGQEHIPGSGPALFLSNHPGMADTISLFSAIGRKDLRVIALYRQFLTSLPHISAHLSYISDDSSDRIRAVRQVSAHLRAGGAALTFPAGKIEPDPDVHTGALEALKDWTTSSSLFMRFVPDLRIIPVLVSGVIWEQTSHHWLTRLKKSREDRERLAAALQLLAIIIRDERPTTVHVHFGKPITSQEVDPRDSDCIHGKLMERMDCLLENRNKEEGVSIL